MTGDGGRETEDGGGHQSSVVGHQWADAARLWVGRVEPLIITIGNLRMLYGRYKPITYSFISLPSDVTKFREHRNPMR